MNPYSSPPKPIDRNPSIIPIPDFSHVGFDRAKAMELANLISVAYDEYEIWDTQQQKEPPDHFIGSGVYIDLPEGIECPQGSEPPPAEKVPPGSYGRLNPLWQSAPAQVKQYQRIDKFWVTEWWWLDTFSFKNLAGLLRANLNGVGQLIGMMKDWVTDDQLFGYIARSQQQPNEIFVVFRGTREAAEWLNNFRPIQKQFLPKIQVTDGNLGFVRNGFELMYSAQRSRKLGRFLNTLIQDPTQPNLRPTIESVIDRTFANAPDWLNNDTQIYVTGHSLGAGLATLAALHIDRIVKSQGLQASVQLYTFASPRVGDRTFARQFEAIDAYRIINSEDLIQSVPLPTTKIVDDATLNGMDLRRRRYVALFRELLKVITRGQSEQQYQHVGIPITFTQQKGTIAGNHNHTKTYRQALRD
ncbi:MAG: lipase family protein [Oscillatoriophycideae cyanobacterium NC_groundwater_1537_Pr4_S-0.65um_50_18]|nr:lipase family protein [Oscillatoriophycideae cyanobacterium NC_groundwater_1537_Pr4_S-0.65um_50_18]